MFQNPARLALRPASQQLQSTSRCLSTTARLASSVPPDSPSYIRLPKAPQSDEPKHERVRGSLPIPRDLFPRQIGAMKTSPEFFQRTVPKKTTPVKESQQALWKDEMARSRRHNLKTGLVALWKRRKADNHIRHLRSQRRHKENRAALLAPEREDDRLNRSTVLDSMLDSKTYADPDRFKHAEESKQRTLERENAKQEARRDALMELYINAANFITKESELKEEIDRIFTDDYFRKESNAAGRYGAAENVWGVYGRQQSISTMLRVATGTGTKVVDYFETDYDRSVKRQKRIAEEFTGGKME